MTPQRAVCRTASGAGVRGNSEQSIHSGLRWGGGAWGDTHALLSRADGILGISPSLPTGSLFLQGGPSLGTLRQAVTPSLSTLSTCCHSNRFPQSSLIRDKQEETAWLKSKGVWGWAGRALAWSSLGQEHPVRTRCVPAHL